MEIHKISTRCLNGPFQSLLQILACQSSRRPAQEIADGQKELAKLEKNVQSLRVPLKQDPFADYSIIFKTEGFLGTSETSFSNEFSRLREKMAPC
jgi:hypothetical protein